MSDWIRGFGADTTWDELQDIIDEYAEHVEADPDLSPATREAARAQIRATFEAGWRRLQLQRVSSNDTVN